MGKYDHICELPGAETYPQWKCQITLALKGEHLWPYCSSGADPSSLIDLASTISTPANKKTIISTKTEKILNWLTRDTPAKAIIDWKVSSIVASQVDKDLMAWEQWNILAQWYSRNDLLLQYELQAQRNSKKLKEADNAPCYLGTFKNTCHHFVQMGVIYSNDEAVFDLLQGLLDIIKWQIFREIMLTKLNTSHSSSTTSTPSPKKLSFNEVAKSFIEKASAIISKWKLAGPGSEYVNVATAPTIHASAKMNSAMDIKMHRNNSDRVRC